MQSLDPAKRKEVTALLAELEAAASHIAPSADRRLFEFLGQAKAAWARDDVAAVRAAAEEIEKHKLYEAEAVVITASALRRALGGN